jgi:glutamate transport system substrate-binding protein
MTRRRWWLAPVLLLVLALFAGACGSDDDDGKASDDTTATTTAPKFATGSTMETIQKRGKLIVGTKFDQPLFGLKNPLTGQIEGFDVEIAKLMAQGIFGGSLEDAAKKIEFIETVSKVREPSITDGKVDIVVATYTINDTRKQVVDFAGPYYVAGQDIMVKKDNTTIKSVTDLNGKKVCSVQGSTSIKNVQEKAPQSDLSINFDTYSKCAEALKDGRVEAVTTDDTILAGLVKDNAADFKLVGAPFTKEPYGIGMKKGDDAFRTYLNDRLEFIVKKGEWAKAWERTVGTAGIATPTPPSIDRYVGTPPAPSTTATTAATTTTAKP